MHIKINFHRDIDYLRCRKVNSISKIYCKTSINNNVGSRKIMALEGLLIYC